MANVKAFGEIMMKLEVPDYLLLEQTNNLGVTYSGTGLNVLSGLSKFGHDTSMITTLPEGSVGDAAASYIRRLGVGTKDVQRAGGYIGQYILERGFSVRPTKVTYSNRKESSFCLSEASDYDLETLFKDVDMIHFCGIMLAVSDQTRQLLLNMAEAAKKQGVTIVFDCNYRPKLWAGDNRKPQFFYEKMLELADICFMTEKDAIHILKEQTSAQTIQGKIEEVLPKVQSRFNIKLIAGLIRERDQHDERHKGFMLKQNFEYSGEYGYNTLERVGAGDGFSSGIMHGWLTGLPEEDWINFAASAGALAHTVYGDSPVCSELEVWNLAKGINMQIER